MKEVFSSFVFSLVCFLLLIFFINNLEVLDMNAVTNYRVELELFDANEFFEFFYRLRATGNLFRVVNVENFFVVFGLFNLFVGSTIATVALLADKLFYKKFYQKPSIPIAIRLGTEGAIMVSGLVLMQLLGFLDWVIGGLFVVSVIIFELLIRNLINSFNLGSEVGENARFE